MKNKYLLAISTGHAFTDMNNGALPAMLPFLIAAGGLKYTQAAGLTFAVSISSTLTQPLFGFMADKLSKTWFLPIGVLLAGCGLSAIGFFPDNYWIMFAACVICGIGIAAFHPDGARLANKLAGKKKGRGMSIFTVGGTIGIGAGPLVVTPALVYLGLKGSAVMAVPAIIMCIVFFFLIPKIQSFSEANERILERPKVELKNEWLKFLWISLAISCRSIFNQGLNTFLPLYWVDVLNQNKAAGGMLISLMTFTGAVVTVIGGWLADRYGMNNIIKAGWIILIPSTFFLTFLTNPILVLLILIPVSIGNFLVNTPLIVLGQQYLPKNVGFASGITLGLGVSIGGVAAPILGSYADLHGLAATIKLLTIMPILGILVAFTCKPPRSEN